MVYLIRIKLEIEEATVNFSIDRREPICANDVALAVAELEKTKLKLIAFYNEFDVLMKLEDKSNGDDECQDG